MLYLYPSKHHLGVEAVGAEEELLDLYEALLELIECADGISDQGVVNLTPFNARLFDFLDLLRQPEPVPEDYLEAARSPAGGKVKKYDDAGEMQPDSAKSAAKVLAFPGVTLDADDDNDGAIFDDDELSEAEAELAEDLAGLDPEDWFEEDEDGTPSVDIGSLPEEVLAALEDARDGLILDDDLMVRILWPEAIHLAFTLSEYLGWSDTVRDADWTREIRWRPAYGTVLRFQAQLIDCICSAVSRNQEYQVRELLQSSRVSVREICFQYVDLLCEDFVHATVKQRQGLIAPTVAEIAKPGIRNAQIRKEAESKAKELGCPVDEITFTGDIPDDMEW